MSEGDVVKRNDLDERTFKYAQRIIRLFCKLPKSTVAQTLGKQLLRSGTSIGANYCEAVRARSKAEFISIMGICLRELNESHYWLRLLKSEDIFQQSQLNPLIKETNELISIFTTISKRTKTSTK
ncbi:four helix bundle protein [Cerasicoccus maritimus]|uniref:four helix bundle protein n=1 Tax=Cerasicoccus maritimus TaxID=490089 RepID=UPI0031B88C29